MSKQLHRITIAIALSGWIAMPGASKAQEPRVDHFNFDDDVVQGDLVRPDAEILTSRRRNPRDSLIRLRSNFIGELYKSVERI